MAVGQILLATGASQCIDMNWTARRAETSGLKYAAARVAKAQLATGDARLVAREGVVANASPVAVVVARANLQAALPRR